MSDRLTTEERRDVRALENELAEMNAAYEAIEAALKGEPVSDFMESFPIVRAAADLRAQFAAAVERAEKWEALHARAQDLIESKDRQSALSAAPQPDLDAIEAKASAALVEPDPERACANCGQTYRLDDEAEPTAFCHPCAQAFVVEMAPMLMSLAAELRRHRSGMALLDAEARRAHTEGRAQVVEEELRRVRDRVEDREPAVQWFACCRCGVRVECGMERCPSHDLMSCPKCSATPPAVEPVQSCPGYTPSSGRVDSPCRCCGMGEVDHG